MSWLAFSDSFEYLCYGSTAIITIISLTVGFETAICGLQWVSLIIEA